MYNYYRYIIFLFPQVWTFGLLTHSPLSPWMPPLLWQVLVPQEEGWSLWRTTTKRVSCYFYFFLQWNTIKIKGEDEPFFFFLLLLVPPPPPPPPPCAVRGILCWSLCSHCRWSGRGRPVCSGWRAWHCGAPAGREPCASERQTAGASRHFWHQCQIYRCCRQAYFRQLKLFEPPWTTLFLFLHS